MLTMQQFTTNATELPVNIIIPVYKCNIADYHSISSFDIKLIGSDKIRPYDTLVNYKTKRTSELPYSPLHLKVGF